MDVGSSSKWKQHHSRDLLRDLLRDLAPRLVSAKRLANDYKKPQTCPLRLILQSLSIYIYIYVYVYIYIFVCTYTDIYIYRIYEIESNGYTNPFLTQNCSCNILQWYMPVSTQSWMRCSNWCPLQTESPLLRARVSTTVDWCMFHGKFYPLVNLQKTMERST